MSGHPFIERCVCPACTKIRADRESRQAIEQALYGSPQDPSKVSRGPKVSLGQLGYLDDLLRDLDMDDQEALEQIDAGGVGKLEDLSIEQASELIEELQRQRGFLRHRKDRTRRDERSY